MEYLKIAALANKCEVKRQNINECYRLIGANPNLSKECIEFLYNQIESMEKDLTFIENKIRKYVSND